MFEYLGLLAKSLASQVQNSQKLSEYLLASLSSVIRLIQVNLRCMKTCKLSLDKIIGDEEGNSSFYEVRSTFDVRFVENVRQAHANWLTELE